METSRPTQAHGDADSAKFDAYARDYEELHANSIGASGEQPSYFADYKARCLEELLGPGFAEPVLDYGCGIGSLTERLAERYAEVHGFDVSTASLSQARLRVPTATFHSDPESLVEGRFGVIVLANVLHHVPPAERHALVGSLTRRLQPGRGKLVVFEHNPYNPLTRMAVSRCEFDDDAILLPPREIRTLFLSAGLTSIHQRFIVFFPRFLGAFRPLEPHLAWLPLGAQQMVYATRPQTRP